MRNRKMQTRSRRFPRLPARILHASEPRRKLAHRFSRAFNPKRGARVPSELGADGGSTARGVLKECRAVVASPKPRMDGPECFNASSVSERASVTHGTPLARFVDVRNPPFPQGPLR